MGNCGSVHVQRRTNSARQMIPPGWQTNGHRRREPDEELGQRANRRPNTVEPMEDDAEESWKYLPEFEDRRIRHAFIRKVFSILAIQLLITGAITCLIRFYSPLTYFFATNKSIWWICFAVNFVTMLLIVCCTSLRHQFPINYMLLMLFTLAEAVLIGTITIYYKTDIILMAVGITVIVVTVLTMFAFQTSYDFTACWVLGVVMMVLLLVIGIVAIFVQNYVLHVVYASLGVVVFSFYLIFDLQLIMGGKHQFILSPDEYILACLQLYLDIVLLFLYILQLVGLIDS